MRKMQKIQFRILLWTQLERATQVWPVLLLHEQNKEARALFTSCAMECSLSADCMQFTEGK